MQRTKLHRFTAFQANCGRSVPENASGAPFRSGFWHFQETSARNRVLLIEGLLDPRRGPARSKSGSKVGSPTPTGTPKGYFVEKIQKPKSDPVRRRLKKIR